MTPAIFGIAGAQLTADERDFFKDADPVGYILFGRNCLDPAQLRALTDDLRTIHGRDRLLISIDQEGGRVARLRPPHWLGFPPGEVFDKLYQVAPASAIEAARVNAQALALELHAMGITLDYHPPLDVRQPDADAVIGDRALGSDPMQVAALGRATLDGLARGGVLGCIKHMPGHGRTTTDTHKALPRVTASAEELDRDIAPFRALNDTPVGMTGHLLFEAWDRDNPATQSARIIADIIRGEIGFDGLLLTDDIDMEALSGPIPERSARAIEAGCDVVLNCWAKMVEMQGIAAAIPALSQAGHRRLERALNVLQEPQSDIDIAELVAKRDALIAAAGQPA